jgi:hypothetical protein
MLIGLEHLAATGAPGPTILDDFLARAAYSARPDGYPFSTMAQGVVLTKPANQPGLRTYPDDPKSPPHEKGFAEDTSVERIAEDRMNDVCDDCRGTGKFIVGTVGPLVGLEQTATWSTKSCRRCNGSGRRWADPIGEARDRAVAALLEMRRQYAIVQRAEAVVFHAADNLRGRQSTLGGNCDVCSDFVTGVGLDRLRSKMCPRCYFKWTSWTLEFPVGTGDPGPHRERFKAFMAGWLAGQKEGDWDPSVHSSIGPADGGDRRAAP